MPREHDGMAVARTPGVGRTRVGGDRTHDRVEKSLPKGLHIRMALRMFYELDFYGDDSDQED